MKMIRITINLNMGLFGTYPLYFYERTTNRVGNDLVVFLGTKGSVIIHKQPNNVEWVNMFHKKGKK